MIRLSVAEIEKISEGKLAGSDSLQNAVVERVVIDSRTFFDSTDSLFFALKGPRNDGHKFIPGLIEKGVGFFVVSDKRVISAKATFIFVNDTLQALQKLAAYIREKFSYPVVAITGSNGKTVVKEWLSSVLSDEFKIVRSPKSYNSQVGVPLSVMLMNDVFELAIFEAGISQPGEMQKLAGIISPDIGILTNIGDAHQENFETVEQKIQEKLLLFKKSKNIVYCCDNEQLNSEVEAFCRKHSIAKTGWSLKNSSASIIFSAKTVSGTTEITATVKNRKYHFKIPFTDRSAIENSCHCFAAASVLLTDPDVVSAKFEKLQPVAMRLEIKDGINNCLLVNDYYNSDLSSLEIALSVVNMQAAKKHLFKKIIISDIKQTGIPSGKLYAQVNRLLTEWKIDEIVGIGPEITKFGYLFSMKKNFYSSVADFKNRFNREHFGRAVVLIKGAREFAFERISEMLQQKAHQTQLEINLNSLVHNLNIFKGLLNQGTKIVVMVKAFSYGSGDVEIAKVLQYQNADYLAVAVADEGVLLREAGINTPIIVMNPEQHSFGNIIDYRLEPNIYSTGLLAGFMQTAANNGCRNYPVHIKLDTGMNRLGLKSEAEINEVISMILLSETIKVESVFSHLAGSDDPELDYFTREQFETFDRYYEIFRQALPYKPDRHILNSAGIERFPEKQYEMVRLGIGLYGISNTGLPLENIGTFTSVISQVKTVALNETVGYNRKGKVLPNSKIAVIPVGYADGIDRKLGNRSGSVFFNNRKVPIVGNICMDMLMIDITGLDANPGDRVEFFGHNIPITEVAQNAGTIPYEILTGISQRVKRVYLQE